MSMAQVLGAFRILRRRADKAGAPGLTLWADVGERAAASVGSEVAKAAHAAEVHDLEAQRALAAGIAGLADGTADPEDLAHLHRAARLVAKSAELDHDIGEAVRS